MRRAAPAIAATVAGLGLLSQFNTAPDSTTPAAEPAPSSGTATTTAAPKRAATTTTAPTGSAARKTVDGPVETNRFGDVQVEVIVQGGKLIDVKALALPNDRERSAAISDEAGPILRSEALKAQNANIDTVSGATYTSESYARSLQAALDKAK
ncbi:MAG: FMN-binding protein [Acidimicrobiales bacterium]